MGRREWTGTLAIVVAIVAGVLGGCGEEDKVGDGKIVERLNLSEVDGTYAIDGDPFCAVDEELLNTSDEVEEAIDGDEIGLVVSSREGGVGVEGVAPFPEDCRAEAKKKLNKLDPPS
jgi:hypothetical protein